MVRILLYYCSIEGRYVWDFPILLFFYYIILLITGWSFTSIYVSVCLYIVAFVCCVVPSSIQLCSGRVRPHLVSYYFFRVRTSGATIVDFGP